jgi:hypothetical protein
MIKYPDKWVCIKLTPKENKSYYRIFACWYGGYLGSDSWQLNSGVASVNVLEDSYQFIGASGSIYQCHKNTYGTSGYGSGVLNQMINGVKDEITIEVMPEDTDFLTLDYSNV